MALLTAANIKAEIDPTSKMGSDYDTFLGTLATAIQALWDELTNRTWEQAEFTEYHNSERGSQAIFLNNFPVSTSADFSLWDDPDWSWGSDTLQTINSDYRVDYESGIIYNYGSFHTGKQSLKATYTAGYTAYPDAIFHLLKRQAAVWYEQSKTGRWHISNITNPVDGGSVSFNLLENNILPEVKMLADAHRRRIM